MQAIYVLWNPNGTMKLYEFVVIFGVFMLILAQIPSFHSLRHINLISLVLCLLYSTCATSASIYIGNFNNLGLTYSKCFWLFVSNVWVFQFQEIHQKEPIRTTPWAAMTKLEFLEFLMPWQLSLPLMEMGSFQKYK